MRNASHSQRGFPLARLPHPAGGAPVEVCLLAQLGVGAGAALIARAGALQRSHPGFVDQLEEPSVLLGGMHLAAGDPSTLHSFVVGPGAHPWHRHAGPRTFTAVTGSAGARLRFGFATGKQLEEAPAAAAHQFHDVLLPADSLCTVRFGPHTWHRFESRDARHAALFALSCHPDERMGIVDPGLLDRIAQNQASVPDLTEVMPAAGAAWLAHAPPASTQCLTLDAAPHSWRQSVCRATRRWVGLPRGLLAAWLRPQGYRHLQRPVELEHGRALPDAGLLTEWAAPHAHAPETLLADLTRLRWTDPGLGSSAAVLLGQLLDAFVRQPPRTVTLMMAVRNLLVRPWRLRTSRLGCPVSSLLCRTAETPFLGRHPVLAQRVHATPDIAEVLLGADDRHLRFRTSVRVTRCADGQVIAQMATCVIPRNRFGRIYMALIGSVHRRYISPLMLRRAVTLAWSTEGLDAAALQPTTADR